MSHIYWFDNVHTAISSVLKGKYIFSFAELCNMPWRRMALRRYSSTHTRAHAYSTSTPDGLWAIGFMRGTVHAFSVFLKISSIFYFWTRSKNCTPNKWAPVQEAGLILDPVCDLPNSRESNPSSFITLVIQSLHWLSYGGTACHSSFLFFLVSSPEAFLSSVSLSLFFLDTFSAPLLAFMPLIRRPDQLLTNPTTLNRVHHSKNVSVHAVSVLINPSAFFFVSYHTTTYVVTLFRMLPYTSCVRGSIVVRAFCCKPESRGFGPNEVNELFQLT
jgi:hypothetical protein